MGVAGIFRNVLEVLVHEAFPETKGGADPVVCQLYLAIR